MTPEEFEVRVASFRRMARPGRNLYLWCGPLDRLRRITGNEAVCTGMLDLPGIRPSVGAEEIRRDIAVEVGRWLRAIAEASPRFSIAVLHDLALWAAYRVGLEAIYQYHASDRRMTVLCAGVSPIPAFPLPESLVYNSRAVQQYFRDSVSPENIVEDANGSRTY